MPWRRAGGCPAWWLQPSSPWLWAMEDEEGYTMLKFGAKRSAPRRQQGSGMAGSPRCQYLVASAGWALSTGLAVAVITLGLRVWQLNGSGQCYVTLNTSATDAENWENGCRGCLERFQLQLKTALCNAPEMDGRECRLCPRDWLQHGNWCYWVSHESRDWQRSRDDCAQKGSALFIIRNREQMQVLQDVTQGRGYVWIGLAVTGAKGTWTWLDGSVLDTKHSLPETTGMVAGMTPHTEQEHVPAHSASGTLQQKKREKKKREKASVPLPKIWGKAPSKGNTRIDAGPPPSRPSRPVEHPTCRNPLVGFSSFLSASQMRMSRSEISPDTLASSSSCLLITSLSSSPSWARRTTSWSFRNRRSCRNSDTIFCLSASVCVCRTWKDKSMDHAGPAPQFFLGDSNSFLPNTPGISSPRLLSVPKALPYVS
uniref:C-type lectin domain-containing protein n=1 Tax=Anas zonorhyncha TaxID=75864 RepID=A0A8B9ZQI2_9AVES